MYVMFTIVYLFLPVLGIVREPSMRDFITSPSVCRVTLDDVGRGLANAHPISILESLHEQTRVCANMIIGCALPRIREEKP